MGQHLLTYLSRTEYPTLFSRTCPLPFWVNIFTDQDLCTFVKTVSFTNMFPSGVQRIDGVVCMVIENYFASCIFWFMLFVIVVTLKLVRLKNLLETKLQFKYQIPRN